MSPVDSLAVASNLSYVLHERSTSQTVAKYAATIGRERSKIVRATRRFGSFDLHQLRAHVVPDIGSRGDLSVDASGLEVLSVMIGAWEMLPRVLRASGLLREDLHVNYTFVDGSDCPVRQQRSLFRAPASLCLPSKPPSITDRWAFASVILRPGGDSVLLRLIPVDPDVNDVEAAWNVIKDHAESTIREFVVQWCCQRSLWDQPVELTLHEFT